MSYDKALKLKCGKVRIILKPENIIVGISGRC